MLQRIAASTRSTSGVRTFHESTNYYRKAALSLRCSRSKATSTLYQSVVIDGAIVKDGVLEKIVEEVSEKGWSVVPDFLPGHIVRQLREQAIRMWEEGQFNPAKVGSGAGKALRPEVRSDHVLWLDEGREGNSPAVQAYWSSLDQLRVMMNRALYCGMKRFEGHLAVYQAGTFYVRHLDRFQGSKHRIMSVILYLNEADWKPQDGGQLRIYLPQQEPQGGDAPTPGADGNQPSTTSSPEEAHVDVLPLGGTLVVFRSDLIYHEVLPARRQRYSLTGWMRDDPA
mmetsp:Transcript_13820/g.29822  ORF Transcript_13820/g.29822 Transcript_13820/m.29822 type:complete len:283 (+) Transcript_13820:1957-2805(+)